MTNLAITGAGGMLGTALLDHFTNAYQILATGRTMGYCKQGISWELFDLLDQKSLVKWLVSKQPEIVIHNAALVNVDACEKEADKAYKIHAETTEIIVNTISKWNAKLVYISTDCVFDGRQQKLYTEDDPVNPLSVYATTKYQGELITLAYPRGIVLRTNIIGWSRMERYSFAEWVLRGLVEQTLLTMFTDVYFTPIHVTHLAQILSKILLKDLFGLFHLVGNTVLSKFEFAIKLASAFDLSTNCIVPTQVEDARLIAPRPKNMTLANEKLANAISCEMPSIDQGIAYFKGQYDNGWLARIKERTIGPAYNFWR